MKKYRFALCLLAVFILLAGTAAATDAEDVEKAVPDSAREILGKNAEAGSDSDGLLEKIGSAAMSELTGALRSALRTGGSVLLIAVLCSVFGALNMNSKIPDFAVLAGVLAVMSVSMAKVTSFLSMARDTISELDVFSKALLPTLAAAGAASGAAASASAKYLAAALFIDVLITVSGRVIMPIICVYLAACTADAAVGSGALRGVAGMLKWTAVTAMTLITLAFVAYLTLTGVLASSADAITMRVAKTALSTAIPVVGGIISDAAGVVMNGAAAMRNTIGVFGVLVICAVCLTPFLKLAAYLIVFKAASALASPVSDPRIGKLLGDIGTAFGMLLGLIGSVTIMMFVSVIAAMRTVAG